MRPALRLAVLVAASLVLSAQSWTEDRGEVGTEEDLLALGKDVAEKVGAPAGPLLRGAGYPGHLHHVPVVEWTLHGRAGLPPADGTLGPGQ